MGIKVNEDGARLYESVEEIKLDVLQMLYYLQRTEPDPDDDIENVEEIVIDALLLIDDLFRNFPPTMYAETRAQRIASRITVIREDRAKRRRS